MVPLLRERVCVSYPGNGNCVCWVYPLLTQGGGGGGGKYGGLQAQIHTTLVSVYLIIMIS